MHVYNYAGEADKEFLRMHGRTPAEELILQHLARHNGVLTYANRIYGFPANALWKRIEAIGGGRVIRIGETRAVIVTQAFLNKMKSKPVLPSKRKAWETPV